MVYGFLSCAALLVANPSTVCKRGSAELQRQSSIATSKPFDRSLVRVILKSARSYRTPPDVATHQRCSEMGRANVVHARQIMLRRITACKAPSRYEHSGYPYGNLAHRTIASVGCFWPSDILRATDTQKSSDGNSVHQYRFSAIPYRLFQRILPRARNRSRNDFHVHSSGERRFCSRRS